MGDRPQESTRFGVSTRGAFFRWLLVDGNRLLIAAGLVVGVFAVTLVLTVSGVVAVGPRSSVATTFGSGIVAGLFTLVTVTLSINQLISSRVFGNPADLRRTFEGGRRIRESVEDIADRPSSPVSIASFIAFTGTTLEERADSLADRLDAVDADVDTDAYLSKIDDYAARLQRVSHDERPIAVIDLLSDDDYSRCIRDTEQLVRANYDRLPERAKDDLDATIELLKELSISRQYYKAVTLQQELARLSQLLVYVGFPSLLVAVYVSLVYQSGNQTTIPPRYLSAALSAAIAVVIAPFAVLISHLLRVSTIMRYTVSVAPFQPPTEWPWRR